MISDIFSDAAVQIHEYLETETYRGLDAKTGHLIRAALVAMEAARIHLDTPPTLAEFESSI